MRVQPTRDNALAPAGAQIARLRYRLLSMCPQGTKVSPLISCDRCFRIGINEAIRDYVPALPPGYDWIHHLIPMPEYLVALCGACLIAKATDADWRHT